MIEKKLSQQISDFLDLLAEAESVYNFNYEKVGEYDKLTINYTHSLELEDLSYQESCKKTTQLKKHLKERRKCKNKVEEYKPIVDFLADKNNKKIINQLKQTLGAIRKVEDYHSNRHYIPRDVNV